MSDELRRMPERVGALEEEVDKLSAVDESRATRVAAIELKMATAGKLGWEELVKIGGLVVALSGLITGGIQLLVSRDRSGMEQRINAVEKTANDNETDLKERNQVISDVQELKGEVTRLKAEAAAKMTDRWTRTNQVTFANPVLEDIKELEAEDEKLEDEINELKLDLRSLEIELEREGGVVE